MHRVRPVKDDRDVLTAVEKHLLNDYQHDFPLTPRPYSAMAEKLGVSEAEVIESLQDLKSRGYVSRVGAVFRANSIGASTLAAMAVPEGELEQVADLINQYSEVNHNYQREHHFNLWFVLTASDEHALNAVIDDIEEKSGYAVMYLPMLQDFHIDLGFELKWI